MQLTIGVIGPGAGATSAQRMAAEEIGRLLGAAGHVVVNGGLDGVMAAVSRGAAAAGGLVIGLLPGHDPAAGNPHLTIALPTGLGELRNGLLVRASDAIICVGGSWGTLSELALAMRGGVPVVVLHGWPLLQEGPHPVETAAEAAATAITLAEHRRAAGQPE